MLLLSRTESLLSQLILPQCWLLLWNPAGPSKSVSFNSLIETFQRMIGSAKTQDLLDVGSFLKYYDIHGKPIFLDVQLTALNDTHI